MAAHCNASRRKAAALCVVVLLSLVTPARGRASAAAAAASGSGAASAAAEDTSDGGFAPLLDSSSAALAERTALRSLPGVLALRGSTLSCADISIGQTGTDLSDMGDGFASLDAGEAGALDALIQGIAQAGGNAGTFPLSSSQLAGANVWLLQHIADVADVGVTYTSVVLPPALAGNRTAQVSYLFGTLGYDCMVSSTPVRADMLPFADFLLPNEQYGLSVVTQLVAGGSAPILSVLFSWTSPFSAEIWILIAASLVFGAMVMYVFEGHDRHEDYGGADLMILLRIGRGCYKAFMNFCAVGGFTPNTPASQTFNIAFAFAMLLLQATYTANLAAYFVGTRTPTGAVSGMASFGAKQLAACVVPDPYVVRLLRTNYPLTSLVVMPTSATTADLLDAVLNGTCAGAVASNLDLRFAMGPRDAAGVYCDMQLVGPLISQGAMAVPFNRATVTPAALAAMNAIVSSAYALGDYATGASAVSFAESRPYCSAGAGLSSGGPLAALTLTQVSGIFFVLLFGAIVAGAVFAFFHFRAKLAGEDILEEEPAGKGGSTRGGGNDMVSREEAVSALCAAVAREAATALQVPPRVAAAAERARAERGAALQATLQLVDVDGARYGKAFVAELVNAPDWLFLLTRLAPDDALRMGSAIRALAAGGPPPGTGNGLAQPSGDPSADALAKARDPWPYFASVNGGANGAAAPGNRNGAKQQGGPPMGMPSFRTGLSNFAAFFNLPSAAPASRRLPTPAPSSRSLAPSEAPSAAPAPLDRALERSRSRSQSQSRRAGSTAASEPAVSLVSRARVSSSVGAGERRSPGRQRPRASATVATMQRRSGDEEEDEPPLSPARSFLGGFRRADSAKTSASRIPRFSSTQDNLV